VTFGGTAILGFARRHEAYFWFAGFLDKEGLELRARYDKGREAYAGKIDGRPS